MDNPLSLMNSSEDNAEISGIQDVEEGDHSLRLENEQFAFSDHECGMTPNHPSPRSSALITPSSPEEFPEVEELYAISQGGRKIRNEISNAVSTTTIPFSFNRNYNKIFSWSESKKIKGPTSIGVTGAI